MKENNFGAPSLKNHFFLPEDQALFDYDQIFSVSSMWIELGMENVIATYDLFVRGMPKNRNFLLFGGLEEIIESIKAWKYTDEEVDFLLANKVITSKAAELFRKFKFTGDVWAMREGSVFFGNEPLVRLTGPLWQINLFTFFLINAVSSNTIFLSKIVRSVLAGGEKLPLVTAPVTRAHANEASLKFGRAAYILGSPSSMVPAFARKFNLPMSKVNTKAYHAFIKSFPSEIEAMRAAVRTFSGIGLMVDTYDFEQGVKNAIKVALELRPEDKTVGSVVIDSGKNVKEFVSRAKYARKLLDQAGLANVRVTVTGNFDEWKILEFVKRGGVANGVIACTELVTSSDDPKLEAVLKLAEYVRDGKKFSSAKLTKGKESYPGKKQVFRLYQHGKMIEDIIGLADEKLGEERLVKMIDNGNCVYELPNLDTIKEYVVAELRLLPEKLKRIDKNFSYKVKISKSLGELLAKAKKRHFSEGSHDDEV